MWSELFLFFILCVCACKSNNVSVLENNITKELLLQNRTRLERESTIFASFNKFFSDLKNFFGIKSKIIQEKGKRVKNAFTLFLRELNKNEPIKPGPVNLYPPIRLELPKSFDEDVVMVSGLNFREGLAKSYRNKILADMKLDKAEHLILGHGYRSESHTVLTEDGYMLTIQRIMAGVQIPSSKAVILHHGLLGSAEDWLILGRDRALPYLLLDNDYDVWLLNARGNRYSKIHTTKKVERLEFWDFSWHEMGVYDLPAAIKFVYEMTNGTNINFIGHSMGATALLVLLSTLPEYNEMLSSAVLMAPLVFMYHAKGPLKLFAEFYNKNGPESLNFLGQTEFGEDHKFPSQLIDKFCKGNEKTCGNPLLLIANGGKEELNAYIMDQVLRRVPAGGSVKTIIHYVQSVKTGFFKMFDYGVENNLRKYDYSNPPLYNLSKVTVPIAIFSSVSDWLATFSDIQTLLPLLKEVTVHHVVKAEEFGHLDFLWSQDAPELVFNFVISILKQGKPKQDPDNKTRDIPQIKVP